MDITGVDSHGRQHRGRHHVCGESCVGNRHSGIYYTMGPLDIQTAVEMCFLGGIRFVSMRPAQESSPYDPVYKQRWPYRYMLTWDDDPA
jgi:hypothetical protein